MFRLLSDETSLGIFIKSNVSGYFYHCRKASKDAARFKLESTSMGSGFKCSYIKASEDIIFHSKYFSFADKLKSAPCYKFFITS